MTDGGRHQIGHACCHFFSSSVLPGHSTICTTQADCACLDPRKSPLLVSCRSSLLGRRHQGGVVLLIGLGSCIAYPVLARENAVPVDRGSADRYIVQLTAGLPFQV